MLISVAMNGGFLRATGTVNGAMSGEVTATMAGALTEALTETRRTSGRLGSRRVGVGHRLKRAGVDAWPCANGRRCLA